MTLVRFCYKSVGLNFLCVLLLVIQIFGAQARAFGVSHLIDEQNQMGLFDAMTSVAHDCDNTTQDGKHPMEDQGDCQSECVCCLVVAACILPASLADATPFFKGSKLRYSRADYGVFLNPLFRPPRSA